MDLASIGRAQKAEITFWKLRAAKAQVNEPRLIPLINDVVACTYVEELSDEQLGLLCQRATAQKLISMGYRGPRSNAGDTITPFFTALLYKVKDRFGDEDVRLCQGSWDWGNFRGFINRTDICEFYRHETLKLIHALLLK